MSVLAGGKYRIGEDGTVGTIGYLVKFLIGIRYVIEVNGEASAYMGACGETADQKLFAVDVIFLSFAPYKSYGSGDVI